MWKGFGVGINDKAPERLNVWIGVNMTAECGWVLV